MRIWGWRLLAVVCLTYAVVFVVAAHLTDGEQFDRIVGLANVYAMAFGAIAVMLVVLDRLRGLRAVSINREALQIEEDNLAAAVLDEQRQERLRLLSTDRRDTQTIDLLYEQPDESTVITYRWAGGTQAGTLQSVADFFLKLRPQRLLILGEPGSGKTVLATHLLIQLLKQRGQQADELAIPVRFTLSTFDTTMGFELWLASQLSVRFQLHEQVAAELVRRRRVLPILDGLDELDPNGDDMPRAEAVLAALNTYTLDDTAAPVVVTCRRDPYYSRLDAELLDATWIEIQPLQAAQIAGYLQAQMPRDTEARRSWQALIDPLTRDSAGATAQALTRALRTPWLLTLAVTACRSQLNPRFLLPPASQKEAFTAQGDQLGAYVADVERRLLFHFIDAATHLQNQSSGTEYHPREVTSWMRTIAEHLRWQERHGGSGTDIQLHTWWPVAGVGLTRLVHGTVAAGIAFVGIVAAIASFVPLNMFSVDLVVRYGKAVRQLEAPFTISMIIVTIGIFGLPLLAGRLAARRSPLVSRSGLRQLRTRKGRRRLMVAASIGITAGLLGGTGVGLSIGLATGLSVGTRFGLLYGATGGAVVGLAFGLAHGLDRGPADAITPEQLIRGDLGHGLIYGVLVGIAAGISGGISIGPLYGAVVGASVGLTYGVLVGPVSAIRYGIAVTISAAQRRSPWRFERFLQWATKAGLLRVSGIAYQIRHRELQLWLSQIDASELQQGQPGRSARVTPN